MNRLFSVAVSAAICCITPSLSQASPYCQADFTDDNRLNFFDVSAFLDAYNNGDLEADFFETGTLNFFDIAAFLDMYSNGCSDLTDSDNDRIPDFAETNNGVYVSVTNTGTDPFNPDTDNDGLEDGDEVLGTVDGLILPGANPLMKDIYIECDWFAGNFQGRNENYRPTSAVETRVVNAFFASSAQNPYGAPDGIRMHLDYGQGNGHTGGNQLPGSPDVILFDFDFNQYKADHFDPIRKGYYHYAIFANRYNSSTNGSSGVAELNGDDFMVTMVNYNSTRNMANTIAHELGHNLGLRHGGFENRNYKPNYNSVMNYQHQFPGVDVNGDTSGDGILDYSHGLNNAINELAIDETMGVLGFGVDFNHNGVIDLDVYASNINCSGSTTANCGILPPGACVDSTCDLLEDHDDWGNINWNRLSNSSDRQPQPSIIKCDNWPGKEFE
jgi:Metallo-peptidase family M12